MAGTYLTIDLDYWTNYRETLSPNRFFKKIFAMDCPKVVVASHESVVRYANKSGCRTIINVDYHSDIVDQPLHEKVDFNEGTWANFIKWREQGTFIWRHPHGVDSLRDGYCHSNMFHNPFDLASHASWKTVQRKKGLANIPLDDVAEVCICLSPYWTTVMPVRDILLTIGQEKWLYWYGKNTFGSIHGNTTWHQDYWPESYRLPVHPKMQRHPQPALV